MVHLKSGHLEAWRRTWSLHNFQVKHVKLWRCNGVTHKYTAETMLQPFPEDNQMPKVTTFSQVLKEQFRKIRSFCPIFFFWGGEKTTLPSWCVPKLKDLKSSNPSLRQILRLSFCLYTSLKKMSRTKSTQKSLCHLPVYTG